jgi:CD109 antigen
LDLPYSVIRGEIVAINIVVFNYMTKDLEADVTLENEQLENFEFAEVSNDVNEQPSKWKCGGGNKYYLVLQNV